jgi:MFS family permease
VRSRTDRSDNPELIGALSDRIGRKKLMMAGCLLAALSYFSRSIKRWRAPPAITW